MNAMKKMLIPLACVSVVLLSGCVKLWQKNLDIKTYMLETTREGDPQPAALASRLWIENVHVLPPYNVRSLILRESDVEFTPSYYTELLLSPSENFRNAFYSWISESGLFSEVSIVDRHGMSHSLVVTIHDFYADTSSKEAVLKIQMVLLAEKSRGNRVLLSKTYQQRTPVQETRSDQLIRAYNQGLQKILTECEKDLAKTLK